MVPSVPGLLSAFEGILRLREGADRDRLHQFGPFGSGISRLLREDAVVESIARGDGADQELVGQGLSHHRHTGLDRAGSIHGTLRDQRRAH